MFDNALAVAFVSVSTFEVGHGFYGGTLGLPLLARDDFGAFYGLGDGRLRMTPMAGFRGGDHPVLGWQVPDIRAAAAALAAKGIALTIYAGMGQDDLGVWTAPDGKAKVAWFKDPDGNVLSLNEVG